MSWTFFLLTYLLGGITFLPLVLATVFLHAYFTFPDRPDLDRSNGKKNKKKNKNQQRQEGADGDDKDDEDDIVQPGDDVDALKAVQKLSREEARARARASQHEGDVAAGYFAVCREYAPMGINAKPIERSTPVGSATVAAPSPSVYQTMYRSIFDRKHQAGPLDSKSGASQRPRKAGNVFYVVLRHGHIMLFDDDEQLEVRHVISLAHHGVSIFSGEDEPTPEGELYIKKNAICLTRRANGPELGPDSQMSKPFYLFSENCSAKEDFYFSLMRNQEQSFGAEISDVPTPKHFDIKHIISLVQKLHSSEDHLQTRWLNGLLGRIFLGVYRTADLENFIREKLTKKISRVKRPSFLSGISIQKIETGDSAPYITNPRLKDLTVEGECGVEADVKYTGNFRIEVAATARIDLGSRFKAREVNLVLAVVLRRLEGHVLFKVKPPPSNRIWFSFQTMPKMEMTLEPIISSKQITYTVILRQIESRIKEVVAETLVLPFWDDTPFFNTEHKRFRGGIFEGDDAVVSSTDMETLAAQMGDVDEVDKAEDQTSDLPHMEKSHSMPVLEQAANTGLFGRKLNGKPTTVASGSNGSGSGSGSSTKAAAASSSSTGLETRTPQSPAHASSTRPRDARSGSFTYPPPSPTVGTDPTNADLFKPSSSPPNESPAAQAMAQLSAKSGIPPATAAAAEEKQQQQQQHASGSSSREATDSERERERDGRDTDPTPKGHRRHTTSSMGSSGSGSGMANATAAEDGLPSSSSTSLRGSIRSQTGTLTRNLFLRNKNSQESLSSGGGGGSGAPLESPKRNALAAVTNAATAAKRWGLQALARGGEGGHVGGGGHHHHHNHRDQHLRHEDGSQRDGCGDGGDDGGGDNNNNNNNGDDGRLDLSKPMGGGRPLPPPGVPLPMPDRKAKVTSIPVPRRRPVPTPQPPHGGYKREGSGGSGSGEILPPPPRSAGRDGSGGGGGQKAVEKRPVPPPPLPKRRQQQQQQGGGEGDGGGRGGGDCGGDGDGDGLLVVEAPADSEPTTPLDGNSPAEAGGSFPGRPWANGMDEGGGLRRDAGGDEGNEGDDDDEGVSAWMSADMEDDDNDDGGEEAEEGDEESVKQPPGRLAPAVAVTSRG